MDLVEDELKSEFVFKNPNAKVLKFCKKKMPKFKFLGNLRLRREFPYLKPFVFSV